MAGRHAPPAEFWMKETDREDSKLNKAGSAVREGGRRALRKIRGFLAKLRVWQKAGLVVCVFFWIISAVIGLVCGRIAAGMQDQTFAGRWSGEQDCAQVSTYVADTALMSEEHVKAMRSLLSNILETASLNLSETQIENGASAMDVCYSGVGTAELTTPADSVSVTAIGVGGDFFNFHPLDLMSGFYFSDDEPMKDRILLDDRTAWRLFGSPYIVGQSVNIQGVPHYIAGVFRRPEKRFYNAAGMGDFMIFMTYDSLCRYTEAGSSGGEGGGGDTNSTDMSMQDAMAAPAGGLRTASAAEGTGSEESGEDGLLAAGTEEPAAVSYYGGGGQPSSAAWSYAAWRQAVSAQEPPVAAKGGRMQADLQVALGDTDDFGEDSSGALGEEEEPLGGTGTGTGTGTGIGTGTDTGTEDASDTPEGSEETGDDTPVDGSLKNNNMSGRSAGDSADEPEQVEINRSRINCYEVVLPNPISGFALRSVRSCLSEAGVDMTQVSVVENTGRFSPYRLALMLAQPGLRSMQVTAVRYPYWENVARAWEDVLIPYSFLELFMRFSPFLFLLFLVLWYATHKSWTAAGLFRKFRDEVYDRQSERIYGRERARALPLSDDRALTEKPADEEGTGGPAEEGSLAEEGSGSPAAEETAAEEGSDGPGPEKNAAEEGSESPAPVESPAEGKPDAAQTAADAGAESPDAEEPGTPAES